MKIKLVHVVECFSGGVFDFLVDLINVMPLDRYEIIVIHGSRDDTLATFRERFPGEVAFFPWKSVRREISFVKDFNAMMDLISLIREIRPNIVHLHSSKAGFIGRLASPFYHSGIKLLYTTHGVSSLRQDVSAFKQRLFRALEKIGSYFNCKVICCSPSESLHMHAYGVNACFVFNGVDMPDHLHACDKENNSEIKIINVGRVSPQKNARLYSQLARQVDLTSGLGAMKFVWVGDGEDAQYLTENVLLTGWKTKKEAINYIKCADIYCSTSLWEGLPLAVIQAMAVGKPLVLSACTGNVDLVVDGENGFICRTIEEYQNAFSILSEPAIRIEMGSISRRLYLENFTIDTMLKNYLKLYEA